MTASVGASLEGSFVGEGNVCASAMKFMSVLDPDVMCTLERTMGSRKYTQEEMVSILRNVIGESLQRTKASDLGFVNKSAEEFRRDLLKNSKFRDLELREMIESIDTLGSERISYSMIMDFFIEAGRRAPREEQMVSNASRSGPVENSATTERGPVATKLSQADVASTNNSNVDYCLDEHRVDGGSRTNLVFVQTHDCFLSCTHRNIERVTFQNEVVENVPRFITSTTDPSATIATVEYSASSDTVVVGLHNSRLMCFDFSTGCRKREIQLSDAPTSTLALLCNTKLLDLSDDDENGASTSGGVNVGERRELIFCGTINGAIVTIAESGSAALRSVAHSKISTHPVIYLSHIPDTDLFVAVAGKIIAVFDATDSVMKNMISAKASVSAVNLSTSTGSLVFSCVGYSSILFVLPRRGLLHKGSEPVEIRRNRLGTSSFAAGKEDRVVRIIDDPSSSNCAVTVSEAGTVQLWNIVGQSPASLLRDGAESYLHMPSSCLPILYAVVDRSRGSAILGGKAGYVTFGRMVEHDEGVDSPNAPGGEVKLENVLQALDGSRLSTFSGIRRRRHLASAGDSISDHLLLVSPHHVRMVDHKTLSVVSSIPISATVDVKQKQNQKQKSQSARDRITCASFGPGRSLLLGTDQGSLLCVSLDRATLGNWSMLKLQMLPGSVSGLFYSPTKRVVGVVGSRGEMFTAEVVPHGDSVVDIVPSAIVPSCDAWASEDERVVVVHTTCSTKRLEANVQLLQITGLGSRLLPAARYTFEDQELQGFTGKREISSKISIINGAQSFSASTSRSESEASILVLFTSDERSQIFSFSVVSEAKMTGGVLEISHTLSLLRRLDFVDPALLPTSLSCGYSWLDDGANPSVLLSFLDGSFGLMDAELVRDSLVVLQPTSPEEVFTASCYHCGMKEFVLVGSHRIITAGQLQHVAQDQQKPKRPSGTSLPPLRPSLLSAATPVRATPSPINRTVKSAAPSTSTSQRQAAPALAPLISRRAGSAGLHPSLLHPQNVVRLKMPSSATKPKLPPLQFVK